MKSGGAAAITFQGLVNALFALKEQYQMRSTWVFGRKAMAQIFGLQDNDGTTHLAVRLDGTRAETSAG